MMKYEKKDEHDDGQAVPLGMANVAGVFYVLIIGASFAVFHAIVSFLLHIFEHSRKLKVCSLYPKKSFEFSVSLPFKQFTLEK